MGLYIKSLLLAFFKFSSLIHGQNLCPSSSCGSSNMTVQRPFKFENEHEHEHEQSPSTNCTYFNLTCNPTQSSTLVHLLHAGYFYVQNIDYVKQSIQLYDPANCLMKRLFDFSLQSSPFKAEYGNYTFYVCPLDSSMNPIIHCLSNATNITVASRGPLDDYRCGAVGSRMLPVDHDEIFLNLTWDSDDDCVGCHHEQSRWGSTLIAKIVAVALTMPGLIIVSLSCCSVFCFHLMRMIGGANAAAEAAPTDTATELPLGNTGLDESKIVACTELVVVSGSDEGIPSKMCWICLENYSEKERVSVIRKCEHCFHACCIQQWLGKNGTCPVCRTTLSDVV